MLELKENLRNDVVQLHLIDRKMKWQEMENNFLNVTACLKKGLD